jgi:hypothetical protein
VGAAYWDTETTGRSTSDGGTGLTTLEMKGSAASYNMNLAFGTTWDAVASSQVSYPYLLNNTQSPAPGLATTESGTDGPYAGGLELDASRQRAR